MAWVLGRLARRSSHNAGETPAPAYLVAAAGLFAAAMLALLPRFTVDDAYITARYAENLALHGALVYNVGRDPVEGYTGVVLPVLLAASIRLGLSPFVAAKLIGIASFAAGAAFLWLLLGRLKVHVWARAAAMVLFLCAPFQPVHAVAGLETSLFAAAVLAGAWALVRSLDAEPPDRTSAEVWLWLALLGCSLVRPEGVILAAASGLVLAVERARHGGLAASALRFALCFLLPGLAYFSWRWWYYGLPVPNTYYAKWSARTYWKSVRGMLSFAAYYIAAPVALCAALVVMHRRAWWREIRSAPRSSVLAVVALSLFVAAVFFQYRRSSLVMNYAHRFFAPFYPLFLVMFVAAIGRSVRRSRRALVAVTLFALVQGALWARAIVSDRAFARTTRDLLASEHIPAGELLRSSVPRDGWLAVVVDAGAVPYFSALPTIDVGGLNDEFLGRRWYGRMPPEQVSDYVFGHDPAAFVFTSTNWDRVEHPNAGEFTDDPRFARYTLVRKYRCDTVPDYFLFVYLRDDVAASPG